MIQAVIIHSFERFPKKIFLVQQQHKFLTEINVENIAQHIAQLNIKKTLKFR